MSKIIHVYSQVGGDAEAQARMAMAKQTWLAERARHPNWEEVAILHALPKNATDIGDPAALPYIHDLLNAAWKRAEKPEDILLLTNADICFAPYLSKQIVARCQRDGAAYCNRWDFQKVDHALDEAEITQGSWYIGADLFAVTAQWWAEHFKELPPFVLGRECWDWAFRILIGLNAGCEISHGIYHQKHNSDWEANSELAGNKYNRGLMRQFLNRHHMDLEFIVGKSYTEIKWP